MTRAGTILVVGSINADLTARVARHPLPGETLHGRGGEITPGGKGANQAVAAARLGAEVGMLGAVGTDPPSEAALSGLRSSGADLRSLAHVDGPTGLAIVTVSDDGENTIVVVPGANATMGAAQVRSFTEAIAAADLVICQGEIPRDGIEAVASRVEGRFLHNPAPVMALDADVFRRSDPLVVNEHEAALVLAQLRPDAEVPEEPEQILEELHREEISSVVLTLGSEGSLVSTGEGIVRIPAARVRPVDTTGAGDAFIGALATRLVEGSSLADAARFASRVGAFAVTGTGAQPSYPWAGDDLPALPDTGTTS